MEKFLSSKSIKDKINLNGYMYSYDKKVGDSTYYKCERYNTVVGCRGRLIVKKNEEPIESKKHSHAPDARSKKTAAILDTIKKRAKTDHISPRELVAEACGSADDPTVAALPSVMNLRRTASRIQNRDNVNLNPKTLSELVFNENTLLTAKNQKFLLYDSAVNGYENDPEEQKRFVIFGTRENLDLLKLCDVIAMDGTFKISPPLFKQLFTIHGNVFYFCK